MADNLELAPLRGGKQRCEALAAIVQTRSAIRVDVADLAGCARAQVAAGEVVINF